MWLLMLNLITWGFIRFLHCKVTLLLSILYTLELRYWAQSILKEWKVMLYFLEGGLVTQIIWSSSVHICFFSLMYLFYNLFISVWTHGYISYTLGYSPISPPLKLFQLCILGALLVGSLCSFGILVLSDSVCWVLSYFLAQQNAPGISFRFPAPELESAISPRSSRSFYWKMVLETKIRAIDVLIATGMSFLLDS